MKFRHEGLLRPDFTQVEEYYILFEGKEQNLRSTRKFLNLFNRIFNIFIIKFFRKSKTGGPVYEMRWATAEDFTELKVMPKMFLDHLPDNVFKALTTIMEDQKSAIAPTESMLSVEVL